MLISISSKGLNAYLSDRQVIHYCVEEQPKPVWTLALIDDLDFFFFIEKLIIRNISKHSVQYETFSVNKIKVFTDQVRIAHFSPF